MPPDSEKAVYRLFLALPVPESIRQALVQAQQSLRALVPDWRISWVKPEHMHLTLQFLGETAPGRCQRLECLLSQLIPGFPALELELGTLDAFPSLAQPRVIFWAVLPEPTLMTLQRSLESQLCELGYAREQRHYHPHLTLGRIRQSLGDILYPLPQHFAQQTLRWQTDRVELIQSELLPAGPRYHLRASYPLQGVECLLG